MMGHLRESPGSGDSTGRRVETAGTLEGTRSDTAILRRPRVICHMVTSLDGRIVVEA